MVHVVAGVGGSQPWVNSCVHAAYQGHADGRWRVIRRAEEAIRAGDQLAPDGGVRQNHRHQDHTPIRKNQHADGARHSGRPLTNAISPRRSPREWLPLLVDVGLRRSAIDDQIDSPDSSGTRLGRHADGDVDFAPKDSLRGFLSRCRCLPAATADTRAGGHLWASGREAANDSTGNSPRSRRCEVAHSLLLV
jgi:hypothetical protein